jgi:AmmeMemoRadiSam system protein B
LGRRSTPTQKYRPKLRNVEPVWVEHQGQRLLQLRDPLGLSDKSLLIPQHLVTLLAMCDGTRTIETLRHGYTLRTGVQLSSQQTREIVEQLDAALVLDNGSFRRAYDRARQEFRQVGFREPSHADLVYPSNRRELVSTFNGFVERASANAEEFERPTGDLVGMVSPHIDYDRGGLSYARLWEAAAPDLEDIELVIVLGTDHSGGPGMITPTRQSYKTPYGVLPTDKKIVDGLAKMLGKSAYDEELNHVKEHSIELSSVWMHHYMGGRKVPVVPILCGSFHEFVTGEADLAADEKIEAAVSYLQRSLESRRTLIIAAGDLAHVGPVFGDSTAFDQTAKTELATEDALSIDAINSGDSKKFFEISKAEEDRRKICGLPPIYLMLRLLEDSHGVSIGYDQCIADDVGASWVSIVGSLLYR